MNGIVDVASRSPWHDGEVAIQRTVGVAQQMEYIGPRVILDHLIDQHRAFFPLLSYIVLATVDSDGHTWGTLLAGRPGFLHTPNQSTLSIASAPASSDPARDGLRDGHAVGLLGIDLQTRRRNRLNGKVCRLNAHTFDVDVEQSYGNCSQYIHIRAPLFTRDPDSADDGQAIESDQIDDRAAKIIGEASTLFIASYVTLDTVGRQVDVSHKGGRPGFVQIDSDGVLSIPDFAGNLYFNTLGNILLNPECGLVFVDFATGDLLQLSGKGEVVFDAAEIAAFRGAERLLRFTPRRIVFRPKALPLHWGAEPIKVSPSVSKTGIWSEVREYMRTPTQNANWRGFRIDRIVDESSTIRSLYLVPEDGGRLVRQKAGQFLPVRIRLPGTKEPVLRSYTLSCAPADGVYRLSIKRDGAVSRHLHSLAVGDAIEALEPTGDFTVDAHSSRIAVYLAAGVGITPILAMLRHTVFKGLGVGKIRPSWLIFAARSKEERAFDTELRSLVRAGDGAVRVTRVLSDPSTAQAGDYEVAGRIDAALLHGMLPFDGYDLADGYDFYLCGPGSFIQDLRGAIKDLGVADERIHTEAFGTASVPDRLSPSALSPATATVPVQVRFRKSGKTATWTPGQGTLLECARASGIQVLSSCEMGLCGTCRTAVFGGQVAYHFSPAASHAPNQALICCAVPASTAENENGLILDL